ncbi:MAG: helix-turn-helix transcriptional regulator [Lachnospiraceae bacterium]|nr:helix-turn-helix transcriptional regulator [Lachnospiraceae bacterium]
MYEVFEQLLQKYGVTPYKVAKEAGVTQTALSNWKSGRSTPTTKTLQKIADYFGVTIDYLMTGKEALEPKTPELTARDERDITKDLNRIMEKLSSGEEGPACYDGQELDPEAAELFRDELEIALRRLKIINKEKYTPKKYKK